MHFCEVSSGHVSYVFCRCGTPYHGRGSHSRAVSAFCIFSSINQFFVFLGIFFRKNYSFSGIWMLNNFLIWSLCIQFLSFSRCNPHIYKVLLPQEKRWCMHARYKYPMRFLLDFVCDCGNYSQRLLIGSGDLQAHRRDSTPARPFRWTHRKVAGFTPALFGPFMLPIYIYHLRTHSQSLQFNQITFNVFVLLQCVLCTVFSVIVLIRPSMLTQSIVCPYSALTFYFKCPCSSPYSTHSSKSKFISGTFFMSSCRQPMCKGFSSSPKKDHFTFCGQLLVVGPTGTSRHFARNPWCPLEVERQQNPCANKFCCLPFTCQPLMGKMPQMLAVDPNLNLVST